MVPRQLPANACRGSSVHRAMHRSRNRHPAGYRRRITPRNSQPRTFPDVARSQTGVVLTRLVGEQGRATSTGRVVRDRDIVLLPWPGVRSYLTKDTRGGALTRRRFHLRTRGRVLTAARMGSTATRTTGGLGAGREEARTRGLPLG